MLFRKAELKDISAVVDIYEHIITAEEQGRYTIGWIRGVYPTELTAKDALQRGDLFVCEAGGRVVGTAIINQKQVDCYRDGKWKYEAADEEVMVLHTLIIDPAFAGRGYGTAFISFYEEYAQKNGCPYLRMDTQAKNTAARRLYEKLGYTIPDIVPCVFNGIPNVQLALIEKKLL